MTTSENDDAPGWASAWPDALAFAGGLAVAWFAGWETTDLVWSLWLSSLVVGYAMIVWTIFGPAAFIGREALKDQTIRMNGKDLAVGALGGSGYLIGGFFLLMFFTFHFGMFHFLHSAFLSSFFPLNPGEHPQMPGPTLYAEVVSRYWIFLPMAFLAERHAFRRPMLVEKRWLPLSTAATGVGMETDAQLDTSVTAEAIAARKTRNAKSGSVTGMMAPYKNVIRMHLLIFFFAFAHFAKLENFVVYAVVYAAYFFPWRLLRRRKTPGT